MVSLEFFIDIILSVDSASNTNGYQEYFLGGKGGRCVGLTILPPSCADCLRNLAALTSWNPLSLTRPVMGLLYLFRRRPIRFHSKLVKQETKRYLNVRIVNLPHKVLCHIKYGWRFRYEKGINCNILYFAINVFTFLKH
jgi:hypothetical protein